MAKDSFFEIAFEGTALKDCIRLNSLDSCKTLVYDSTSNYGTTYKTINDFCASKYTMNTVIHKESDIPLLLEAFPNSIRSTNKLLEQAEESGVLGFISFCPINEHLYISHENKVYKIPYSKTDIAECSYLSLKEKNHLFKFLNGKMSFDDISLSHEAKSILIRGICEGTQPDYNKFEAYMRTFGNVPFLYPKHGIIEICEMFARSFAMNGTGYIVNSEVQVTKEDYAGTELSDFKEYKYKISSPHGIVWTKMNVPRNYESKVRYKRVLLTSKKVHSGLFYAIYDNGCLMRVLCLNSDTFSCPEHHYLIYVTKQESIVRKEDLQFIGLEEGEIHLDISFNTNVDLDME